MTVSVRWKTDNDIPLALAQLACRACHVVALSRWTNDNAPAGRRNSIGGGRARQHAYDRAGIDVGERVGIS